MNFNSLKVKLKLYKVAWLVTAEIFKDPRVQETRANKRNNRKREFLPHHHRSLASGCKFKFSFRRGSMTSIVRRTLKPPTLVLVWSTVTRT